MFQSLKRDNCLSNSRERLILIYSQKVSIAQARQLPLQLNWLEAKHIRTHRFQSLKRDNCLSNLPIHLVPFHHRVRFQSLKRDNCLSNFQQARLVQEQWNVSIAQARQLPLQPNHLLHSYQFNREFQSLKRDNCLSNGYYLA